MQPSNHSSKAASLAPGLNGQYSQIAGGARRGQQAVAVLRPERLEPHDLTDQRRLQIPHTALRLRPDAVRRHAPARRLESAPVSGADLDQDRRSSPQGNVTGLGIVASYSARFWTLGDWAWASFAGLAASAFGGLLRLVERLTYGVHRAYAARVGRGVTGLAADRRAAGGRGRSSIVGLRILGRSSHRRHRGDRGDLAALRQARVLPELRPRGALDRDRRHGRLARAARRRRSWSAPRPRAALASGRELPVWQRRLLVAAGAGAGFAAVYNVPLGGALLALEVMLGTLALPLVLPALLMSRDRDGGRLDLPRRPPDLPRSRRSASTPRSSCSRC